MVHIYYGDGKGKTTSAAGLALRCAGQGKRVVFCSFLKDNTAGERKVLEQTAGVTLLPAPNAIKFVVQMTEEEKAACRTACANLLRTAFAAAQGKDMLVLDEVIGAVETGMVEEDQLLSYLPVPFELVLTGRNPGKKLLEQADYLSEICNRKHPFDQGVPARKGIEF